MDIFDDEFESESDTPSDDEYDDILRNVWSTTFGSLSLPPQRSIVGSQFYAPAQPMAIRPQYVSPPTASALANAFDNILVSFKEENAHSVTHDSDLRTTADCDAASHALRVMSKAFDNHLASLFSGVKRQRNSLVPISQLPPEVLGVVFSHLLEPEPKLSYTPVDKLLPAMLTCSHWHQIILATPTLWSRMRISGGTPWWEAAVRRSGSVKIQVLANARSNRPALANIQNFFAFPGVSDKLQSLYIHVANDQMSRSVVLAIHEHTVCFPALESVTLDFSDIYGPNRTDRLVLLDAPNLNHLVSEGFVHRLRQPLPSQLILRKLRVSKVSLDSGKIRELLDCIEAASQTLEVLSVEQAGWPEDDSSAQVNEATNHGSALRMPYLRDLYLRNCPQIIGSVLNNLQLGHDTCAPCKVSLYHGIGMDAPDHAAKGVDMVLDGLQHAFGDEESCIRRAFRASPHVFLAWKGGGEIEIKGSEMEICIFCHTPSIVPRLYSLFNYREAPPLHISFSDMEISPQILQCVPTTVALAHATQDETKVKQCADLLAKPYGDGPGTWLVPKLERLVLCDSMEYRFGSPLQLLTSLAAARAQAAPSVSSLELVYLYLTYAYNGHDGLTYFFYKFS